MQPDRLRYCYLVQDEASNRWLSCRLLLTLVVLFALVATAVRIGLYRGFAPVGTDDQYYYAQARSLIVDRDLDLANELGALTPRPDNVHTSTSRPWDVPTPTGRVACKYGIGAPMLLAPFLVVAHVASRVLGVGPGGTDGYAGAYYFAWYLGNFLLAYVAVFALTRVLRTVVGLDPWNATKVAWITFLLGPLLFHTVGDTFMSHVPAAAVVTIAYAIALDPEPKSLGRSLLLGLTLGVAVAVRQSNAVHCILLASLFAPRLKWRQPRVLAACAGLFVGFLPQLLAWKYVYGSFLVYSYTGESVGAGGAYVIENLFSTRSGLAYWNPAWGIGLFLVIFGPLVPWMVRLSAILLLALNASWWCWWWGDTYGGRAFSSLLPHVGLALGYCDRWMSRSLKTRVLYRALLVLCFAWALRNILVMEFLNGPERAQLGLSLW